MGVGMVGSSRVPAPILDFYVTSWGRECRSGTCVAATTVEGAVCDPTVCAEGPATLTCVYPPSDSLLVERNAERLCRRKVSLGSTCGRSRTVCEGSSTSSLEDARQLRGYANADCGEGKPPSHNNLPCGLGGQCAPPSRRPVDGRPCHTCTDTYCGPRGGADGDGGGDTYCCHRAPPETQDPSWFTWDFVACTMRRAEGEACGGGWGR